MYLKCLVALLILLPRSAISVFRKKRKSIDDLTCQSIRQPLNHFALPRHSSPHYEQRYCTFEFDAHPNATAPVFFYTGNESPIETYINHTGLLWQLAESLHATVVFAEHRYEGQSLPSPKLPSCLAYSSSYQAIADYARLIELHYKPRPVILFGGSYGGMLSAWMRFLYPHLVAGAIAASAPIWGLPQTCDTIDGAAAVINHGLRQSYPPTVTSYATANTQWPNDNETNNFCADNLLAAWPLMHVLAKSQQGRTLLTDAFSLCSPMEQDDLPALVGFAQSPWFDLAEGSFPYPSSYIPFALTHNPNVRLPAWPLQAACWNASRLAQDLGVRIVGNTSNVTFFVEYGQDGPRIAVDWDNAIAINMDVIDASTSELFRSLLVNVRDAIGVWFNMTKDVQCYNLTAAPNMNMKALRKTPSSGAFALQSHADLVVERRKLIDMAGSSRNSLCEDRIRFGGSWSALVCNEEMNLIIDESKGMGRDMFWPPSHPRGTRDHADIVAYNQANNLTLDDFCKDPHGIFGFPDRPADPWSTWLDTLYGGTRIDARSNVIFSNGLLDPWSAAGVYAKEPTHRDFRTASSSPVPGIFIQNVSKNDVIALVIELGGHHTDLMYDDEADPTSIRQARHIEGVYIRNWVQQWIDDYSNRH